MYNLFGKLAIKKSNSYAVFDEIAKMLFFLFP